MSNEEKESLLSAAAAPAVVMTIEEATAAAPAPAPSPAVVVPIEDVAAPAVVVTIEDAAASVVLSSINEKLRDHVNTSQITQACTIYRVRENMRKEYPEAYHPQVISIGPYHRSNEQLLPMERLKQKFLHDLIARHGTNPIDSYINALATASFISEAKKCYSEPVAYSGNAFVEMMVFDGCFIIEFLVKSVLGEHIGELEGISFDHSVLENDLLLLENQIPFSILQTLFDCSFIPKIHDISDPPTLKELAVSCISRDRVDNLPPVPEVIYHLLHLRHSSLSPPTKNTKQDTPGIYSLRSVTCEILNNFQRLLSHAFFWVLCVLLTLRRPPRYEPSPKAPRTTPNATELREAGVRFQIKKTSCFLDVTFSLREGVMEMPRLPIQALTLSQFRNLVAFEQCCPTAGNHFTSYVALLDNLIDEPNDVALLERSGVLESKLGGDDDVARFFNNLGKGAHLNYENHYLLGLFRDVTEYCATERHRWRARLMHDYFGTPWSTVSVIAAVFLLLLTLAQTIFAFLAYFRPPKNRS